MNVGNSSRSRPTIPINLGSALGLLGSPRSVVESWHDHVHLLLYLHRQLHDWELGSQLEGALSSKLRCALLPTIQIPGLHAHPSFQ